MSKEKNQCGNCGIPKDSPNYAYHICVKPRINGKTFVVIMGAIKAAIYFDKVTQYMTPNGSAVIMSAKKYRELVGEELPNTPVKGITVLDEVEK